MHTELILLGICLCIAAENPTPVAPSITRTLEDEQINDVGAAGDRRTFQTFPYSQEISKIEDKIGTTSYGETSQPVAFRHPTADFSTLSHSFPTSTSTDQPSFSSVSASAENTRKPSLLRSTDGVYLADSDSELVRHSHKDFSRINHQQPNKNMAQKATESSIAAEDAESGDTPEDGVQQQGGEQNTPTFPSLSSETPDEDDGEFSPQPPVHSGHVDVKINIPHIFQFSLGDTADGRRQLGIQAPFFRLDLTRPRFKVFKK